MERKLRCILFFGIWGILVSAISIVGLFCQSVFAADKPVEIRVAVSVGTTINQFLRMKPELLKHDNKSYKLDLIQYFSGSPQIPVLAAKKLDLCWFSWDNFSTTIVNAGLDLKIIADIFQDKNDHWSNCYAVLDKSPTKNPGDLRGKTIGIGSFGTTPDFAVREMMKRYQMEYPRDYNLVEVKLPAMEAMLRDGKIDCGNFIITIWNQAQKKGGLRKLFTNRDIYGESQELMYVARSEFIDSHRQVLVDFLEDLMRVTQWFLNPANHKEAVQLAAQHLKIPVDALEPWAFTKEDTYKDPFLVPNIQSVKRHVKWFYENKYISKPLDVDKYTDLSLIEQARKQLEGK